MLQNVMQFNGGFGCGYCMHQEKAVSKGNGKVMIFPVEISLPEERVHDKMLKFARTAVISGRSQCGVKRSISV